MVVAIGPCAKQIVTAIIVDIDGKEYVGTNYCLNAQTVCPRGSLPTGSGYWMCKDICNQSNHAEINALLKAGDNANGATLHLYGHTYICENCNMSVEKSGIKEIIIHTNK